MAEDTMPASGGEDGANGAAATARRGREKLANYRTTRHFSSKSTASATNRFERRWLVVDAQGQSLGRLASQVAILLKGKHRPEYTPHDDVGDFVIVVNAAKVQLRGNDKPNKKMYYKYTGYRGHMKSWTGAQMIDQHPEKLVQIAVGGMLPRGSRGSHILAKLKVYAGPNHPHAVQKPQKWSLEGQAPSA